MTILAKYYPYKLAGGVSWDDVKEDATDQIVDCIARVMQNLKDLYICGSGAHPGGGVSGAPGHNAARRVIADLKRK